MASQIGMCKHQRMCVCMHVCVQGGGKARFWKLSVFRCVWVFGTPDSPQFIDSIWRETAGLMSVQPKVHVCAANCDQNKGPWFPCIIHYRQESHCSYSLAFVTDDTSSYKLTYKTAVAPLPLDACKRDAIEERAKYVKTALSGNVASKNCKSVKILSINYNSKICKRLCL